MPEQVLPERWQGMRVKHLPDLQVQQVLYEKQPLRWLLPLLYWIYVQYAYLFQQV